MSSGWIVALEIGLVLGVCLMWAYRELRALRVLREERQTREKSTRDEMEERPSRAPLADDDRVNG